MWRKGLAVLGALVLAGCETMGGLSLPTSFGGPPAVAGDTAASETGRERQSQSAALVEPDRIPTTTEMIGMDGDTVTSLLGAPSLRRAEQTGEIWQYATEACVLFLFFYPGEDEVTRVNYLAASAARTGEASPGDQDCVEAVTRAAVNGLVVSS